MTATHFIAYFLPKIKDSRVLTSVRPEQYETQRFHNTPCKYGSFAVRLNSSPGTKHVRRQYLGEPLSVLEEELVQIVITPDATPQTRFDPVSVTFTHTGGMVDGKDTYRWDEPATFKVTPVDDKVDERAGVTIDFSAFSIKQSHYNDEYWSYTVPYQVQEHTGDMYDASSPLNNGFPCSSFHMPGQQCTPRVAPQHFGFKKPPTLVL